MFVRSTDGILPGEHQTHVFLNIREVFNRPNENRDGERGFFVIVGNDRGYLFAFNVNTVMRAEAIVSGPRSRE